MGNGTVIIVGAGISGLMCASLLLDSGHRVIVVEARDRAGGRIHSVREAFSHDVEAGAEFMHGQQPLTMKLLDEVRGNLILRKGKHYNLVNNQLQQGNLMDDYWPAFFSKLNELQADMSLDEFLQQHFKDARYASLRESVISFAEGFDIADTSRVSVMALREEWASTDEEEQYHIKERYQCLVRYLFDKVQAAGGEVYLSTPVENITWKKGNVTVIAGEKQIRGTKVIVTAPLGVLQKGVIRFDPPLPDHQWAFKQLGFGGVIKFLLEFKDRFWESGKRPLADASFIFSDAQVPTWWTLLPESSSLITGWLGGPAAVTAASDPSALLQQAIQSLEYITDTPATVIRSKLVHWHIADWVNDPYSYGAYTYPTLETRQIVSFLSQPVEETIYFSGEAFYNGTAGGTVEAALGSAQGTYEKLTIDNLGPH